MQDLKKRYLAGAATLVLGMGLVALPAQAKGPEKEKPGNNGKGAPVQKAPQKRVIVGVVTAIADGSVTVQPLKGDPIVVALTAETRVDRRGPDKTNNLLSPGDRVVLMATVGEGGALTAQKISAMPGKPKQEARKIAANGTVQSVTATTLTLADKKGATLTVTVADSTRLQRDGKPAPFSAFVPGDTVVALYLSDEAKTAVQIVGKSAKEKKRTAVGVVASVSPAADGTLQDVTLTLKDGATLSLTVNADTHLRPESGFAAALKPGARVQAQYVGETSPFTALSLHLLGPAEDNGKGPKEDKEKKAVVVGVASAVDADAEGGMSITVAPNGGKAPVTITVTADTKVTVDGASATLADISVSPAAPVKVKYHIVGNALIADQIEAGVRDEVNFGDDEGGETGIPKDGGKTGDGSVNPLPSLPEVPVTPETPEGTTPPAPGDTVNAEIIDGE